MKIISLSSLSLHNFRNYQQARIDVSPDPVVLFGHNGAGKTNLLEALSLLAPGRGLRRAKIADFIPSSAASADHSDAAENIFSNSWAVVAYVNGRQGEAMIATGKDQHSAEQEKRALKIDGKPARIQADLARHMSIIWLTPQMEQLFIEGTSEGRKFLDRLVYSFDCDHASHVHAYEQAMRERNRLLYENKNDHNWLLALEKTMAEKATIIASARLATVQHLNHAIDNSAHSFPKPHIAVRGTVEDELANGKTALDAENSFLDRLKNARIADKEAGRALSGAHRSELIVIHREKNRLASLCSTGEQKALILSIILAQSRAGALWNETVPLILLDEVVAHLDARKRIELFEEICHNKSQTWMTGTDRSLFAGIEKKAQFFEVKNGMLL